MDDLVEGEWVQSSESVSVSTNADASCFIAMSVSPTGAKFWTDSSTAEIARFVPGTSESDCADIDELASGLGSEDNSGGSGITDGAMSWPGWGTVNMMKSSDDGTSADLRIFVDTMNASKSASEPSTSFTNLPFLQTDAATPTSGFTASITDAHILVNGQDIVVETGATITGYMDSPNLVHQLEFPSIRVPVDALPAMWSDWDGGTLMFKVDGVQQGLVMSTADWQDGAP